MPIFVTEFGISNYSGDGGNNTGSADKWLSTLKNGSQKISWINWSFSDKEESSAALKRGACVENNWSKTTSAGAWAKSKTKTADNFVGRKVDNGPRKLTLESASGGKITSDPGGTSLPKNSKVKITAVPDEGYGFSGWTGSAEGLLGNPAELTMNMDHTVGATFIKVSAQGKNFDFSSGETAWELLTYDKSKATGKVVDGAYQVTPTVNGTSRSIQLQQNDLTIIKDIKYTVSFDAWSAEPCSLEVRLGLKTNLFANYLGKGAFIQTSTTPTPKGFSFIMGYPTTEVGTLSIMGGLCASQWNVDNVHFAPFGEETTTPTLDQTFAQPKLSTRNSTLFLDASHADLAHIEVYSINGHRVFLDNAQLNPGSNQISFDHLDAGYYMVKVQGAGISESIQMLKLK